MTIANNIYGSVEYVSGSDEYASVKQIRAVAKAGYSFASWQGDVDDADATANPLTLTYRNGVTYKKVVALFRQDTTYTLTTRDTSNGSCQIVEYPGYPQHKTIIATPSAGYRLKEWSGDSAYITSSNKKDNPLDVYMISSKRTTEVEALFEEDPRYTKVIRSNGSVARILSNTLNASLIGRYTPGSTTDSSIVRVEIGTVVNAIEDDCFRNCTALATVSFLVDDIDSSVATIQSIGKYAFYNTSIASFPFERISGDVSQYAFSKTKFTSLDLTNSNLTSIAYSCFRDCTKLASLTLPSTIVSIGNNSFAGCLQLMSIDLMSYKTSLPSIYASSFDSISQVPVRTFFMSSAAMSQKAFDDVSWSSFYPQVNPQLSRQTIFVVKTTKNNTKIEFSGIKDASADVVNINFGDSFSTKITDLPDLKTTISHKYTKSGTYTITIDDSLSSFAIGYNSSNAKTRGPYVTSIDSIGSKITSIPSYAYAYTQIASLTIPSNITDIGHYTVSNCSQLSFNRITVANGAKLSDKWIMTSGLKLFDFMCGDSNNTTIDMSSIDITTLAKNVFNGCHRVTSIVFPKNLQLIDGYLAGAYSLENLTSMSIASGGSTSFSIVDGVLKDNSGKAWLVLPRNSTVPVSVTKLANSSILANKSTTFTIPDSVVSFSTSTFQSCRNLQQINVLHFTTTQMLNQISEYDVIYRCATPYVSNNDDKIGTSQIAINCSDGSLAFIGLSDRAGYVKKSIDKSKVHVRIFINEYSGGSSPLLGIVDDEPLLRELFSNYSNDIVVYKNGDATATSMKSVISTCVQNFTSPDDLLIFIDLGHGGSTTKNGQQVSYMSLCNSTIVYDYEFWNLVKNASCRIFAIFCTCHSGTMYQAPSLDAYNMRFSAQDDGYEDEEDEEDELMMDWARSAVDFFSLNKQTYSSAQRTLFAAAASNEPNMLVWSACADNESAYCCTKGDKQENSGEWKTMQRFGQMLLFSMFNNIESSPNSTYDVLWDNMTTDNEPCRTDFRKANSQSGYSVNPQVAVLGDFDINVEAFT